MIPIYSTTVYYFYRSNLFIVVPWLLVVIGIGSFQQIKWDRQGTKEIVIYTSTSGIHYCGLYELFSKVCDMYMNCSSVDHRVLHIHLYYHSYECWQSIYSISKNLLLTQVLQSTVERFSLKARMRKLGIRSIRAAPLVRLKLIELRSLPSHSPVCALILLSEAEHLVRSFHLPVPQLVYETFLRKPDSTVS